MCHRKKTAVMCIWLLVWLFMHCSKKTALGSLWWLFWLCVFLVARKRSPSAVILGSCRERTVMGCGTSCPTSKHRTGTWRWKGLSLVSVLVSAFYLRDHRDNMRTLSKHQTKVIIFFSVTWRRRRRSRKEYFQRVDPYHKKKKKVKGKASKHITKTSLGCGWEELVRREQLMLHIVCH